MSQAKKKGVYTSRNSFIDLAKKESESFSAVEVKMETMDTALLLLNSEEEMVLITVLKHITEFARKRNENILVLYNKNLLQLLLDKEFYMNNRSILVQRFALYLVTVLVEQLNMLTDLGVGKAMEIMSIALNFYLDTLDGFSIEYLSIIVNKCLEDPQAALQVITKQPAFLQKFFVYTAATDNPDTLLHSFQALYKLLLIQSTVDMQEFVAQTLFPIDRILCDLTNEFPQIRNAALQLIKILLLDYEKSSPLAVPNRAVYVLQQLTTMVSAPTMIETLPLVVQVLACAMRNEQMARYFFENNLFDKMVEQLSTRDPDEVEPIYCRVAAVFSELARYEKYLQRISRVTELLINCLLSNDVSLPEPHIVQGLVRMLKHPAAAKQILEAYTDGLLPKLLKFIQDADALILMREQCSDLLGKLLLYNFHPTATELFQLQFPQILGAVFGQSLQLLSIDFILSLLGIIENLAQNEDYRVILGESRILIQNLGQMLKNSFSTAILVTSIFRCLCMLIEEENVRTTLLSFYLAASIKRGLRSLAHLVKASVTNFIIQTARFPEFVHEYIEARVLEVLIMNQKHAFNIPTWGPAIEVILSKSPSLKFCIRNHLSFADSTVGSDFLVPKQKFEHFSVFLNILKEEVSPLRPILVVNFQRPQNPAECIVNVPKDFLSADELTREELEQGWSYCRQPGDDTLPQYLKLLHHQLDIQGLSENALKIKRCVDFDNVIKRAKVIAKIVAEHFSEGLKVLDLNAPDQCCEQTVQHNLKTITKRLHCNFIPIGMVHSGCQFERAVLFKALADQIALPCTLQRSVNGKILFNELPLPMKMPEDIHCDAPTMKFLPWGMLRPTHIIDLLYNVGELYPLQSREALQYLRLY